MKTAPKPPTHHGEQPKLIDRISGFLSRHRRTILIGLIVVAVAIVALVVVLTVESNRSEAALTAAEALQRQFDDWSGQPADQQPDGYDAILRAADDIIRKYPETYAAMRARLIDARALSELERYSEAVDRYVEVADRRPLTYLAPVALMDAAVAAENADDSERALELYNRLADTYKDSGIEIPRAILSIGRIHEQRDEIADAAAAYQRLIDDYPASSWTNLARNRIITLTVQGRIGG